MSIKLDKNRKRKYKKKNVVYIVVLMVSFIIGMVISLIAQEDIDDTPIESRIAIVESVERSAYRSNDKCYTKYDFVVKVDNKSYKVEKTIDQINETEIETYNKYEKGSEITVYKRVTAKEWQADRESAKLKDSLNEVVKYISVVFFIISILSLIFLIRELNI